jgi:hypothetical protein
MTTFRLKLERKEFLHYRQECASDDLSLLSSNRSTSANLQVRKGTLSPLGLAMKNGKWQMENVFAPF